jgi:hypothetical protein
MGISAIPLNADMIEYSFKDMVVVPVAVGQFWLDAGYVCSRSHVITLETFVPTQKALDAEKQADWNGFRKFLHKSVWLAVPEHFHNAIWVIVGVVLAWLIR